MNEMNNNQKLQFAYNILEKLSQGDYVDVSNLEKAKEFIADILDLFTPDMK
jgi:hypothetical protein